MHAAVVTKYSLPRKAVETVWERNVNSSERVFVGGKRIQFDAKKKDIVSTATKRKIFANSIDFEQRMSEGTTDEKNKKKKERDTSTGSRRETKLEKKLLSLRFCFEERRTSLSPSTIKAITTTNFSLLLS